ncbi:hypothetical protein M5K25_027819 [Dendrobium thyrsiflorum]|uniref:Uncharacterized protein n=1 Tax=Dendrobium thyrsiflorum TaxID=117978 RepID=A0ABD0TUX9_DENTH
MSGLKVGETEEDDDADFLPTEVCRVILAVPSTPVSEKYVKKEAPESCMMVLPMDCSSEKDLYFPEEDESDPDIASQMEHVNLGSDSESVDGSPDATMADSEENVLSNESKPEVTAQVQLRSGKIMPPPPKKGVSDKEKGKEIVINEDIIPKDPKKKDTAAKGIDYNILSHLRKIPAQLSIYDTLDDLIPADKKGAFLKPGSSDLQRAIDFYICAQSDAFVPAFTGLFYGNVAGRRIASGRTQILVPSSLSPDFLSSFVSKKNHLAYSCYC